ncbi:MAG: ATP-binding protein, partial [Candidatus Gastranaerophilales bacterium]|nr:ATP-binding protein [Candidatus Gastranaerophilales bacterium]
VYINVTQNFDDNTLIIKVKDEGIGISSENLDKIFKKFSRIDSPLTRKIQGNGLGLYITKNLIEKMSGKITVTSETGAGTEFTLVFKAAKL